MLTIQLWCLMPLAGAVSELAGIHAAEAAMPTHGVIARPPCLNDPSRCAVICPRDAVPLATGALTPGKDGLIAILRDRHRGRVLDAHSMPPRLRAASRSQRYHQDILFRFMRRASRLSRSPVTGSRTIDIRLPNSAPLRVRHRRSCEGASHRHADRLTPISSHARSSEEPRSAISSRSQQTRPRTGSVFPSANPSVPRPE